MKDKIRLISCGFLLFSLLLSNPAMNLAVEETAVSPSPEAAKEEARLLVDLDLKDVDIRDVARALSRISGKNIIVSEEIKIKVTLRVKDVHWKEALGMILSAYNLAIIEKETYIILTTLDKRRLAEESGELQTRIIGFNFIDVGGIQKTLATMLTARGKIEADVRTNSLVITDIPERIEKIKDVALRLDTKTPQVTIEAMMLTVKLSDDDQLGVDWTLTHKTRGERVIDQDFNLGRAGGMDITYGKTLFTWAYFTSLIEYWKEEKKIDILANPRVLTLDNLTATIDLTEQIPYQKTTTTDQGSTVSTDFKDAVISLYVKPHITKDNYIFMNIKTEQSYLSGYTSDVQPIIDSRKAETNVMVREGETVVIGGLRKKEDTVTENKFPILGDVPVLGKLFKKTVKAKVDTELLIFVTPHIANETRLSENETKHLEKVEKMKAEGKPKALAAKQNNPFPLRSPLINK